MSTTIDALRNLGLKVNGEEPQSNYVNNVINEIADNYSPSEAGMSNPMTTAGDIIVGGTSGAPTRLAKGTQGQVLSVGSSGLEWANASGGGSSAVVIDINSTTNPAITTQFMIPGLTDSNFARLGGNCSGRFEQCTFTAAQTALIEQAITNRSVLIINIDETDGGLGIITLSTQCSSTNDNHSGIILQGYMPGNIGEIVLISLGWTGSAYELSNVFWGSYDITVGINTEFTDNVATFIPSNGIDIAWEQYSTVYNTPNLIINGDKAIFIGEENSSNDVKVYTSYQYTYFIEAVSTSGFKITRVANTPISRS